MEPIYPAGTPEYEAYAAELRTELSKFAKGEEPYPYRREGLAMPTVPNWIAKGYAVSGRGVDRRVYKIVSWRATKTQAVVTLDNGRAMEYRFRLDDLREVGKRYGGMHLVAPDSDEVIETLRMNTIRAVRNRLTYAVEKHEEFMRQGEYDVENIVASISNVQRAATKAMADLADLL